MSRRAGGFLGHLYAARPRADDSDPRPERGVMALAGEIVQARQVRYVGLRTEAGAEHEIAGSRDGAVA